MTDETDTVTTVMLVDGSVTDDKIASISPDKIDPQGADSGLDADTLDGIHVAQLRPLTGEVRMWAGSVAAIPDGWAYCNGAPLSRTDYAALFSAIGTIYGAGNGSTTFNLPDFRDRSPMGATQDVGGIPMTSVSGSPTQSGGEAAHTLTIDELPPHGHDMSHTHDVTTGSGLVGAISAVTTGLVSSTSTETTSTSSISETGSTGNGDAHNVLHPYFAITYIIYVGEVE